LTTTGETTMNEIEHARQRLNAARNLVDRCRDRPSLDHWWVRNYGAACSFEGEAIYVIYMAETAGKITPDDIARLERFEKSAAYLASLTKLT
jgi:hypothetical protein